MLALFKDTFTHWQQDHAPTLAAALAYYTIFALAPILIIAIAVANFFLTNTNVQADLINQAQAAFGPDVAETVRTMLNNREPNTGGNVLATLLGVVLLVVGATGVFGQLQYALNTVWGVRPDPKKTSWTRMLWLRLRSLGLILIIGLVLIVSFAATTFVSGLEEFTSGVPGSGNLWQGVELLISFAVITLLFAFIFKVLPDAVVRWQDVWLGAAVTALLFSAGKFLIGLYLAQSAPASAYGAAGSLVLLLLWIYFSAQIFLLGAEFTQAYANRYGAGIKPDEDAMRIPGAGLETA